MAFELTFLKEVLASPLTLLYFFDDDVQSGRVVLAPWQKELLTYFGKPHAYNDPAIRAQLLAANGSGKSQFILAPIAIWSIMKFTECLTIITTASGAQLDGQDLRYCTRLATKINSALKDQFPEGVIECQYRKLKNLVTESYIDMFATDEPGKAEGKHPLKFDGKFFILIDEGKTVADEIYEALERCTGYTHRLDISSSGKSVGKYYADWNFDDPTVFKKRVTAFDCPHIPVADIEKKIRKHGLHDPLIRSMIFSEFTSVDQQVVIPREMLLRSVPLCDKFYDFGPIRGGLDLAAGGDENAFSIWKGNKEIARHAFKFMDTSKTVVEVIKIIESYNGLLKAENINADDGGVGRGILDNFREKGYSFRRVLNQARPFDITRYNNRGTEYWFRFKRFIEEYQVLFIKDERGGLEPTLLNQLSNRYYKLQDGSGRLQLESKAKAKAEGHPSPDRADAIILAWCDMIYPLEEINGSTKVDEEAVERTKSRGSLTAEQLTEVINKQRMDRYHTVVAGKTNQRHGQPKIYNQRQMRQLGKPAYRHDEIYKTANGGKLHAIGRFTVK